MTTPRIPPPPINVDANDFSYKRWFKQVYDYSRGGVLVPNASVQTMYGGTRNYLLNGDFQIWQRGTSFTVGAVVKVYGPDRWCQGRGSIAGSTISQLSNATASGVLPLDFRYGVRCQRTVGDTNLQDVTLIQCIESANAVQLRGKTVVLSYWVRKGAGFNADSFLARIFTGTGTDENIFTGISGRVILTATVTDLSTDWKFYSHSFTLDSNINEINVGFSYHVPHNATAVANEYFDITGVQLELARDASAPIPTAYEYIPFDVELMRCGRYYQKSFQYATTPATATGNSAGIYQFPCPIAGATSYIATSQQFTPRMRTTPTVTFYNPIAANAFVRNYNTNSDATATTTSGLGEKAFALTCTGTGFFAVGHTLGVHWTADAEI